MSIVDIPRQQHSRSKALRTRYNERRKEARSYEIYYVLIVTVVFAMLLLLCTTGILVLLSKQSRALTKDECHNDHSVNSTEHQAAEAPTEVQEPEESAASPNAIGSGISPLQHILKRDFWEHPISNEVELEYVKREIQHIATMEESSLVIGETIVSLKHKEDLHDYVRTQMEASGVIQKKEATAILAMIHLNSSDLIFLHAQTGMMGSLKNSLTLALCTQKDGNIHFMLVILRVEAHLGWKFIPKGERSSWNMAMKASLEQQMRSETEKLLNAPALESNRDSELGGQWFLDSLH